MSATKWTPGPWVWRYDNWLVGADGESVLEASDNGASYGMHSCVISHHYAPAVAAANKRLIAEAPAMAEALRALVAWKSAIDKLAPELGGLLVSIYQAEALLARLEGRE